MPKKPGEDYLQIFLFMKQSILLAAMGVLFFIGLTSMALTPPPYNATQCQEDCELFVDLGIFSGQGACMSACATCTNPSSGAGSVAACNCHILEDTQGLEAFGFSNFGQCVNFVKDLIGGN